MTEEGKRLARAGMVALGVETASFMAVGLSGGGWLGKARAAADDSAFVEAQLVEMPPEAHLVSQATSVSKAAP